MSVYTSKNTLESRFPCAIGEDRWCPKSVDVSTKIVCMLWLCGAYMRIYAYVINHHYNINTCLSSIDLTMDSRTWLTYYLLHLPIYTLGSSLYDFGSSPKKPRYSTGWSPRASLTGPRCHLDIHTDVESWEGPRRSWTVRNFGASRRKRLGDESFQGETPRGFSKNLSEFIHPWMIHDTALLYLTMKRSLNDKSCSSIIDHEKIFKWQILQPDVRDAQKRFDAIEK